MPVSKPDELPRRRLCNELSSLQSLAFRRTAQEREGYLRAVGDAHPTTQAGGSIDAAGLWLWLVAAGGWLLGAGAAEALVGLGPGEEWLTARAVAAGGGAQSTVLDLFPIGGKSG